MESQAKAGNENIENVYVPISIFTNGPSCLESISRYLKEKGYRYCDVANILNRDDRTIWGACRSAEEKSDSFTFEESSVRIPLSIFKDRSISVLEAIAEYLKEVQNMKFCNIAGLLNRDQRTVWTVYNRAKKKRRQNAQPN